MAKEIDKLALTEAALEEIREAIYEPRTNLAKVRRQVGRILGRLREQTGEDGVSQGTRRNPTHDHPGGSQLRFC